MDLYNKSVLVTGSDGFIGSHLIEELLKYNCKIIAFVYYNSFNSWGWLDALPVEIVNKIDVIAGDIRDANFVEKQVSNVDVVFHLAALIGIPYSYHAPQSYVDTNIQGTLNILNAAKKFNTKKIIVTSTSEVYGSAIYVPIDEKHPLQGQSPYSATKIAADKLSESFYKSFDIPLVIARPFNTYGPRQSARAVIPNIITQILSGDDELKIGNLTPIRDFNYVKDVVSAFAKIAICDDLIGHEVNIASGESTSIKDLINTIIDITNSKVRIIEDKSRYRPDSSEVDRLIGDNKKITSMTDWKPKYNIENGIKETIDWLKVPENLKKYKSLLYNI